MDGSKAEVGSVEVEVDVGLVDAQWGFVEIQWGSVDVGLAEAASHLYVVNETAWEETAEAAAHL